MWVHTLVVKVCNKYSHNAFTNYQKDKKLLQLWLTTYAQVFPNFVLPPFVPPSLARSTSRTKFGMVSMGGVEEGTRTIMEVDSIATKVVIESTQVALDTIEITTETMHPSILSTIVETKEGTKNLRPRDDTKVAPMVE